MDDQGLLCEAVCNTSPAWLIELVVFLLVAARALYLARRSGVLSTEVVQLKAKVEQLSLRPPPPPPPPAQVTLQLAPHPGLASLVPIAVSIAPADTTSTEKNAENADEVDHGDPFAPDPDYVEPPKDGS